VRQEEKQHKCNFNQLTLNKMWNAILDKQKLSLRSKEEAYQGIRA